MTAYWDALRREVQDAAARANDDFVEIVIDIETRVIRTVSLTTGDREFPDDLRQEIQGVIAVHAVDPGHYIHNHSPTDLANARARARLLTMRSSILLEELHRAFHRVGERRAVNRYDGYFTDDPSSFIRAREAKESSAFPVSGD
jgi:hypothetical protein